MQTGNYIIWHKHDNIYILDYSPPLLCNVAMSEYPTYLGNCRSCSEEMFGYYPRWYCDRKCQVRDYQKSVYTKSRKTYQKTNRLLDFIQNAMILYGELPDDWVYILDKPKHK